MKKRNLRTLALMGIASGVILSQTVDANERGNQTAISSLLATNTSSQPATRTEPDPNDGNLGYHLMTEEELMLELNDEGQKMYKELDPSNKKLALEVASKRCANTSACKGLNACKTDKNSCAGQGSCKGQGKCAISDKNLAVKLVYDKMMKKRAAANGG